jgi:hypothetical protein
MNELPKTNLLGWLITKKNENRNGGKSKIVMGTAHIFKWDPIANPVEVLNQHTIIVELKSAPPTLWRVG